MFSQNQSHLLSAGRRQTPSQFYDYTIYPFMDLNETAQIFAEAIEYQASVQS